MNTWRIHISCCGVGVKKKKKFHTHDMMLNCNTSDISFFSFLFLRPWFMMEHRHAESNYMSCISWSLPVYKYHTSHVSACGKYWVSEFVSVNVMEVFIFCALSVLIKHNEYDLVDHISYLIIILKLDMVGSIWPISGAFSCKGKLYINWLKFVGII
jgi:hypothetical protein